MDPRKEKKEECRLMLAEMKKYVEVLEREAREEDRVSQRVLSRLAPRINRRMKVGRVKPRRVVLIKVESVNEEIA